MNEVKSSSRFFGTPGAIVCLSLSLLSATAAHASNEDRASRRDFANAAEWRAARFEQILERREMRAIQQGRGEVAVRSLLNVETPGEPFNLPATVYAGRNDVQDRSVVYPGQVSNFRTTRPVSGRSTYTNDAGQERVLHNGVSLDLSSSEAGITIGENLLGGASVSITVGDSVKQIKAGEKVTAAEYAALNQVLVSGAQDLVLNSSGAAVDGSLNINLVTDDGRAIKTSQLVIPSGVEVAGDFGRHAEGIRVTNDLVNNGALYVVSTDVAQKTVVIGARDIVNGASAIITTDVVDSIASQFGSTNAQLNLAVRADRALTNAGEISASGHLELSAGESINNSGVIASRGGDVIVEGPVDASIEIDNTGGRFIAAGDIKIATSNIANSKTDTRLIGGDWLANNLNIYSGDGHVNATVGDVSALVNAKAGTVVFNAAGSLLTMGSIVTTGDPLFSNSGDLQIAADITTSGAPLSIIAGGNITVAPGVTTIDTSLSGGAGGDILIVAGAAFTTPADLEITGGSTSGGDIDLTGITTFRSGVNGSGSGGRISIYAFGGNIQDRGAITIPDAIIDSRGLTSNGNITVVSGVDGEVGINLLGATSAGADNSSGSINLSANSPFVFISPVVIETTPGAAQGTVLSGAFGISSGTVADLIVGDVSTKGASIDIAARGNITVEDITTSGLIAGDVRVETFGSNKTIAVGGVLAQTSSVNPGADIQVRSGAGGTLNLGANWFSTTNGTGGSVLLDASDTGNINFTSSGLTNVIARGTAGGTIDLIAATTSDPLNKVYFGAEGSTLAGGSITIETSFAQPLGTSTGAFSMNPLGATTGGTVRITSGSDLTINDGAFPTFSFADGIEFYITSSGVVTLTEGNLFDGARGGGAGNANGGKISIVAADLLLPGSDASPFRFDAQGQSAGNGGFFSINIASGRPLVAGTFAKPPKDAIFFTSTVESGSTGGNGGTISLSNGGLLYASAAALSAAPQNAAVTSDGGSYSLSGSQVVVDGTLDASGLAGGDAGTILIGSNSKKAFVLGADKLPKNGVLGDLLAVGTNGEVIVSNNLGGISVDSSDALSARRIVLSARGKGAISTPQDVIIKANLELVLVAENGAIGKKDMLVDAPSLEVNTGGSVSVLNMRSGAKLLADSSGGKKFSYTGANGVTLVNNVFADDISLTGLGVNIIVAAGFDVISQGDVDLSANTVTLQTGAAVRALGQKGGVTITTVADTNINDGLIQALNGDVDISAGDEIVSLAGASVLASVKGSIDIDSLNLIDLAGGVIEAAGDINISAANGLTLGAQTKTIGTGGDIFIVAGANVLGINANTVVEALNGSLEIVNTNLDTGSISLGAAADLQTTGNGGDIKIAIGAIPKKGFNTTPPANITATIVDGSTFFDGVNGSIVAIGANDVIAERASVFISNGSNLPLTNLISFGGSVFVKADPPPPVVSISRSAPEALPVTSGSELAPTLSALQAQAIPPAKLASLDGTVNQVTASQALVTSASAPSEALSSLSAASSSSPVSDNDLFVDALFLPCHENQSLETETAVVYAPSRNVSIETRYGSISIARGALVLVVQSSCGLAVYDLDDHSKNAVVVRTHGKHISLSPGLHATVSSHSSELFEDANAIELVQHRGLRRARLNNGWHLYTSEFAIPSALFAVKPLRELSSSTDPNASSIKASMMKTAAVVLTLRPDRGDYVQFFKSQRTAMR